MPNVTLATVLKFREDLLVELAADKGLAIDGLRRHLETLPGRTHLRTVADSLVPSKPQDDAYASYIAWLSDVAGKLRLNSIGELEERLAEFTNRKSIGNIEETTTLSYPAKVAGKESRDPWQEIRVGTVKAVLDPASDLVTRALKIYDRPREEVLRYVENNARAFRRGVTRVPLIEPSAEVIAVAMSTNAEHVHIKTLSWWATGVDTFDSHACPQSSSAVGDSRQPRDALRPASRRSGGGGSKSWREVIDSISNTVVDGRDAPVLIAINAPLGWPGKMIEALTKHEAGDGLPSLDTDADDYGSEMAFALGDHEMEHATRWRKERNRFFRRETERIVREAWWGRQAAPGTFGPTGLDVGADKSARTAHAALRLLKAIRRNTGLEIPVITDCSGPITQTSAIEVYTGWPRTPTQDAEATPGIDDQGQQQGEAVGVAVKKTPHDRSKLNASTAVHTAIAFLERGVGRPNDHDLDLAIAKREGWIWFPTKEWLRRRCGRWMDGRTTERTSTPPQTSLVGAG